jgi:hypothetical protein
VNVRFSFVAMCGLLCSDKLVEEVCPLGKVQISRNLLTSLFWWQLILIAIIPQRVLHGKHSSHPTATLNRHTLQATKRVPWKTVIHKADKVNCKVQPNPSLKHLVRNSNMQRVDYELLSRWAEHHPPFRPIVCCNNGLNSKRSSRRYEDLQH